MATTKKTNETTEKKTTTRKRTTRKAIEAQPESIVELKPAEEVKERSIFELMAEKFPAIETEVETPVGIVKVKNRISLNDMVILVDLIVNMCTDAKTGMVKWEIYDFVTKLLICSVYCGIDVPQDLEVGYSAVCGSGGLYELIAAHIDDEQLDDIRYMTADKLRAQENLNCSVAVGKLNQFLESVSALMDAVGNVSEGFSGEEATKVLEQLGVLTAGK